MQDLFIPLLAGHLIGDFLLQTRAMAEAKKGLAARVWHAAVVGAVTCVLVAPGPPSPAAAWLAVGLAVLLHFAIDTVKSGLASEDWNVYVFLIDQAAHVLALVGITVAFTSSGYSCLWMRVTPAYFRILILISGLILCVWFGAILMGKALQPVIRELGDKPAEGLRHGGRRIGQLERALTYLLVLSGNAGAIGFLFAAKSILRFGEIKQPGQRKEAEYIVIGTFASFGWALLVAVLTQRWLAHV